MQGGTGAVIVGVMYVPCAEVPEQVDGIEFADAAPHDAGI